MKNMYYYQKGMCKALGYNSLNPVLYTSDNDIDYTKQHMVCNACETGKCNIAESCQLLLDAPYTLDKNTVGFYESKL